MRDLGEAALRVDVRVGLSVRRADLAAADAVKALPSKLLLLTEGDKVHGVGVIRGLGLRGEDDLGFDRGEGLLNGPVGAVTLAGFRQRTVEEH